MICLPADGTERVTRSSLQVTYVRVESPLPACLPAATRAVNIDIPERRWAELIGKLKFMTLLSLDRPARWRSMRRCRSVFWKFTTSLRCGKPSEPYQTGRSMGNLCYFLCNLRFFLFSRFSLGLFLERSQKKQTARSKQSQMRLYASLQPLA